ELAIFYPSCSCFRLSCFRDSNGSLTQNSTGILMNEHTDLRDGGTLDYDSSFLTAAEADSYFQRLRDEIAWRQETIRGGPVPRLIAWYADPGVNYTYSRITHHGQGW